MRTDQLSPTSATAGMIDSMAGPLATLTSMPAGGRAGVPAVLLIPGYTGSKEDFVPILDPLAQAGFLAVAVDQPGQYESHGPADEAAYTPSALGPVIASVVRQLASRRRVVLVGHSFGGLVSRAAVLTGAPVSGIVLLCSGPAAFTSGNRFDALTRGESVLRSRGPAALFDGAQRAAGLEPDSADPLQRFYRRRFLASTVSGLLGMGDALLTEPDRTAELATALAAAHLPAAVIAGEADDAWPLQAQAQMADALGTELVLVPGGAHSPAVEAPGALLDILVPLLRRWVG